MNEDTFNMSVRKFLKTVGVTAQREIEQPARILHCLLLRNNNRPFEAIAFEDRPQQ